MADYIIGYFLQMLYTVGTVALFGLLIALMRRLFCRIAGRSGPKILLATGIIGTPIHELSHALMCIVFGHKITEIKLYQPNSSDGALGYVSHSYRRKNIYHQIGNFFIGTAPVIIGSGMLTLLMLLMIPDASDAFFGEMGAINGIGDIFACTGACIGAIFSGIDTWQTWAFLILAIMIASHMEMSVADIKGGLGGLGIMAALWLLISAVIFLISDSAFESITSATASFALILAAFLSLALIFLGIMVLIAIIFKLIANIF